MPFQQDGSVEQDQWISGMARKVNRFKSIGFLRGHLKSKIYITQPKPLDDLRQRIIDEFGNIWNRLDQNLFISVWKKEAKFSTLIEVKSW